MSVKEAQYAQVAFEEWTKAELLKVAAGDLLSVLKDVQGALTLPLSERVRQTIAKAEEAGIKAR